MNIETKEIILTTNPNEESTIRYERIGEDYRTDYITKLKLKKLPKEIQDKADELTKSVLKHMSS